MKNIILIVSLLTLMFSCGDKEPSVVHYKFKNVQISRFDDDKKSYFYIGYCNNGKLIVKKAMIKIDWQFDDFLQASMIFHNEGKVEIVSGGGGKITMLKASNKFYFKEHRTPQYYSSLMNKYIYPNDFKNMCRLSDNLTFELERNKEFKSDVLIEHEFENDLKCP